MDHHHHAGADAGSADALAELVELDAEVLHGYLSGAIAWVASQAPPRRPGGHRRDGLATALPA